MLTENPTDKELKSVLFDADNYAWRIANNRPDVRRKIKKKGARFVHRSKLPDGQPVYYVLGRDSRGVFAVPALIAPSHEPDSKAGAHYQTLITPTKRPIADKITRKITGAAPSIDWYIIRGHAIKRYIERHNHVHEDEITQQMVIEAENHLMLHFNASFVEGNDYDNEIIIYFDGGGFFGNIDDNLYFLRTFNMNRQLFPNQRMLTLSSENEVKKMYEEFEPNKYIFL